MVAMLAHEHSASRTQKRSAHIAAPPAKRAKTGSSSSLIPSADSPITDRVHERYKRAERCFERANPCSIATKEVPFINNDPPFSFKKAPHGSDLPVHGPNPPIQDKHETIGPTAPTASLLAQMNATNAREKETQGSDAFRGVIDDLTVQNKKLRQKLQKFERLHCAHLQKEKLFEVRIHGLPAHKKRELERTLRNFASSIDEDSLRKYAEAKDHPSTTIASSPVDKPASSSASDSRPVDSAYASMSGMPSWQPGFSRRDIPSSTQRNVKSYLNDIPKTLIPNNPLGMSEKAKSTLVVRRLEQIFTGRGPTPHRHSRSQQQQEVSTAAAEAERCKIEACGRRVWREGTREAHILPDVTDLRVDPIEDSTAARISGGITDSTDVQPRRETGRSGTPEQRPTRPLDLDIHRAQIPSDNIAYIRHLHLPSSAASGNFTSNGDGAWLYLNLLTSMAQLHTLNVTPEFIRKSITAFSQKLELSTDGTKVRWLGGTDGSRLSPDSDGRWKSSESSVSLSKPSSTDDLSMSNTMGKAIAGAGEVQSGVRRRPINMETAYAMENFQYKPMFFHQSASSDGAESGLDNDTSDTLDSMEHTTGTNSGSNAVHERQWRLRGRKHDSGPIIFYNRAKFCTDLGGDPTCAAGGVSYTRFTQQPLGCPAPPTDDCEHPRCDFHRPSVEDAMKVSLSPSPIPCTRSALDLEDLKTSISDCASQPTHPLYMDASGLGGIQPSDNFVVKVQRRHGPRAPLSPRSPRSSSTGVTNPACRRILHALPKSTMNIFRESSNPTPRSGPPQMKSEVVSAVKTPLAPSPLPPPSYVVLPFSSSSDSSASSDAAETESESNGVPNAFSGVMDTGGSIMPRANTSTIYPPMHYCATDSTPFNTTAYPHPPLRYPDTNLPRPIHNINHGALPLATNPGFISPDDSEANESSCKSKSESESSIDLLAHARLQDPDAVRAQEEEWDVESEDDRGFAASLAVTGGSGSDSERRRQR